MFWLEKYQAKYEINKYINSYCNNILNIKPTKHGKPQATNCCPCTMQK